MDSDALSAESCIRQIFEWRYERDMTVAKWAMGASASLVVALTVAFFRSEQNVSITEIGWGLLGATMSATYGIYMLVRLRHVSTQFTAAVSLYSKLKRVDEFIRKYRVAK